MTLLKKEPPDPRTLTLPSPTTSFESLYEGFKPKLKLPPKAAPKSR
jgi:hypothetical protein